ncbi:hypothetical protein EV426DRAFT_706079 [Tirmania nivea]|nr:hypothetical protein EV426DRAFT_706079 [Tirmania nivea]
MARSKHITSGIIWYVEEHCYAYVTVEDTAGVLKFEEAEFISSHTISSGSGSSSRNLSKAGFKADIWAKPAMMLLPDVMTLVSIDNTSQISTWDNLPGYVHSSITSRFLGCPAAVSRFPNQIVCIHRRATPYASVNMFRVWGWFIINVFIPLSSFIWYFGVHWGTERKMIVDGPLAALLTHVQVVRGVGENDTLQVHQVSTMTKDNEAGS